LTILSSGDVTVPMPSKFTAKRRELILVALAAGGSRRTAAQVAGIDHSTLGFWLKRGATASAGSRYREFGDQVLAAEAAPHRPRLLPLDEPTPLEIRDAWTLLANEWLPEPLGEPFTFEVFHSDGTPVGPPRSYN
jgi:hypothetical protein